MGSRPAGGRRKIPFGSRISWLGMWEKATKGSSLLRGGLELQAGENPSPWAPCRCHIRSSALCTERGLKYGCAWILVERQVARPVGQGPRRSGIRRLEKSRSGERRVDGLLGGGTRCEHFLSLARMWSLGAAWGLGRSQSPSGQREGIKGRGRRKQQVPTTATDLFGEQVAKKNVPRFLLLGRSTKKVIDQPSLEHFQTGHSLPLPGTCFSGGLCSLAFSGRLGFSLPTLQGGAAPLAF